MKSVLYWLLGISLATLWIFNFFAGIVGGIWLIALGNIWFVVIAVVITFIMPYIYSLAMLPSLIFAPLLIKAVEAGNRFFTFSLGFIMSGYNNFLLALWVSYVFDFIVLSNNFPLLPALLFGYSIVMGPIGYMASKEGPDAGTGTTFGLLFVQISYLMLAINILLGGHPDTGYAWIWLLLIVFTIVSISIGISYMKPEKENPSDAHSPNNPEPIDPLTSKAVDVIAKHEYDTVSASLLQRRLEISFTRASNIKETLIKYGVIQDTGGAKPNKILVAKENLEQYKNYFEGFPKYDIPEDDDNQEVDRTDDFYAEVVKFVKVHKEISSSTVQKHFNIGFNRTVRFFERMEEDNIVEMKGQGKYEVITQSGENISFCSNCGKKIDNLAAFCKYCGFKLPLA